CDQYRERCAKFLPARELLLKPVVGEGDERLRAEAALVRRALPTPCRLVALDRRGRGMGSRELATFLQRTREEWPHALAFVVGSDLGLATETRSAADLQL